MDRLHGILVFLRVVEHGTLSGAARALGVSTAAVSAAVTRLERQLAVRLLTRTTRRVGTTAEGAEFYARCKRITADLAEAERAVGRAARGPSGLIRVRLPLTLGRMWIVPRLPEFMGRYPELTVEVVCMDFVPYTMEEGIDLSVQTGELHDSSLAVRRLATAGYAVCGSPGYFARRGRPAAPDELRHHACIAYRRPRTGRIRDWRFEAGGATREVPVSGALAFNRIELLIEAAIAGCGLIQIPECYAQPALARGELELVLRDCRAGGYEISAVYRQQHRQTPNVRAFMNFVTALFDPPPW
ncbi:MAG: LysR family transcriptional regulator [Burkholderiales bacterium]|nr:LysR family transcriptional regulator [Burkholderiales bacterium]